MGDYVPFYYAPRSPMLYSIKCGNVPGVEPDQDRIVYLVARTEDFSAPSFVVSDGNAAHDLTSFHGSHEAIHTHVDWEIMRATYWANTDEDGDRMRRRMAEFLVHRFVEWPRVRALATRVAATRQAILALYERLRPAHRPPVSVNPGWYYP